MAPSSIAIFTAVLLTFSLFHWRDILGAYQSWRTKKRILPEPFFAEVLHENEVVATISDRENKEMFWHEYSISPIDKVSQNIIENDDLWDQCKFTFRDPKTNRVCNSGLAGGGPPYIKDGRIQLRGLYFYREKDRR